jgi:hypothetical protein
MRLYRDYQCYAYLYLFTSSCYSRLSYFQDFKCGDCRYDSQEVSSASFLRKKDRPLPKPFAVSAWSRAVFKGIYTRSATRPAREILEYRCVRTVSRVHYLCVIPPCKLLSPCLHPQDRENPAKSQAAVLNRGEIFQVHRLPQTTHCALIARDSRLFCTCSHSQVSLPMKLPMKASPLGSED